MRVCSLFDRYRYQRSLTALATGSGAGRGQWSPAGQAGLPIGALTAMLPLPTSADAELGMTPAEAGAQSTHIL